MTFLSNQDIARKLESGKPIPAARAANHVQNWPGLYSIWIDNAANLPPPFSPILQENKTTLLYIGKADDLFARLIEQDLNHKNASTFFRGLGAILGFRPGRGSLIGKANENNYRFSDSDTAAIIQWIKEHILVRFAKVEIDRIKEAEKYAIKRRCPLLNTLLNPKKLKCLADLRLECRRVALLME